MKQQIASYRYSDIVKILAGGAVGTLIMSIPMYYGPAVYLPQWPVPHVLAAMLGMPLMVGWLLHFAVGWIFTGLYMYVQSWHVLSSHPRLLLICYTVAIYLVAVGSWLLFVWLRFIQIGHLSVLTYPYLLEHILFAGFMKWTIDALSERPARSNYDLL